MSLDLDEIEQRANAATPGPWRIVRDQTDGFYGEEAYDIHAGDGSTVAQGGTLEDGGPSVGACYHEDAEFIAHAREDVPALVAEVRRLRETVEALAQSTSDLGRDLLIEGGADGLVRTARQAVEDGDKGLAWYASIKAEGVRCALGTVRGFAAEVTQDA